MKSILEYSSERFNYYNSIQSNMENKVCESYEELFSNRGAAIDSVMHKLNVYSKRISNKYYVNESQQDVLFNLDEQFAARDMFVNVANRYIESLCNDFASEHDIQIDEGVKDVLQSIQKSVKNGKDKAVEEFKKLGEKVKEIKKFIQSVISNAIKSAKEFVNKITEMMINFGGTLKDLILKLGGNEDEGYELFKSDIEKALKDEKTEKENVYETFGAIITEGMINESEDQIFELFGWGKKKDKEKDKETKNSPDKKSSNDKSGGNEYDDLVNGKGKKQGKKNGWKMIKDAGWKMILQMMAYYAAVVLLPAVVTLFGGPLAGAVVEVLARVFWSGSVIWRQVAAMIKTYKTEEYKNSPTWAKVLRWSLLVISVSFAIYAGGKAIDDGIEIGKKILNNAASEVLPSDVVQKITGCMNDFIKKFSGHNTAGYDKLVAAQEATYTEIIKLTSEAKDASDKGQTEFDTHKSAEFKASETNTFDHTKDIAGEDLAKKMEEISKAGAKSSKAMLDNVSNITADTPGVTAFAVDGQTLGKIGRSEYIEQIAKLLGVDRGDIDISQVSDTALRSATNGQAGTVFQVVVKGDSTSEFTKLAQDAVNQVAKDAGMSSGFFHMMSNTVKASDLAPVEKISKIPADLFKNSFSAFAGIGPIAVAAIKNNGAFNLRLGSGRTLTNHIYEIDEKEGVQEMTYADAKEKYGSKNPKAFAKMEKIVNDNYKAINKYKEELENKPSLTKEERKKLKKITEQIEKMKEGSSEYKVLVFYTKDTFANTEVTSKKKVSEAKEGEDKPVEKPEDQDTKKGDELLPVTLFNPIMMAAIDLAPRSKTKAPRANPYFAKGILSRWEILPTDGGMDIKDVIDMLTKIMKESLKACYDMAPDVPFIKDGKKYVENEQSIWKDKERLDFGGFTNKELTAIFNDPDSISDYLGGEYASDRLSGGHHEYSEQTNDEKRKAHNEKVIKEYEDMLTNNEEVKEIINNDKSLKKALYDDKGKIKQDALRELSDNLIRVEKNFMNKTRKKGFFAKLKDFFFGKKEDESVLADVDPEALKQLALKCASLRKKKYKKRVKEGLEDFLDWNILDANISILESEFEDCWYATIFEGMEDAETEDLLS